MFNSRIRAALAAPLSLGAVDVASAASHPTPATATAPGVHNVYIAGSSAAADAIINYIENTIFGAGTFSVFATQPTAVDDGDFRAVSGTVVAGQPFPANSTLTVYYRPEGGSVIGALAVLNKVKVKQLDLTGSGCITSANPTDSTATYTCSGVVGLASLVAADDSWGPAGVSPQYIDIGVSDLEPGVFSSTGSVAGGGNQDPVAAGVYTTGFIGNSATNSQLQGMEHFIAIQQTFGFVVHTDVSTGDLQREQVAAIFDGAVTDWSQVPQSVTTGTIIICNGEVGTGIRAAADIFLNGIGCVSGATTIPTVSGGVQPANNLQTLAELDCVNNNSKSIGYVSVDNFSKLGIAASFPSVKAVTISGMSSQVGSNTVNGSADGTYDMWFEASVNEDPRNVSTISPRNIDGQLLYNALKANLPSKNSNVGGSSQVSAIPGLAGNAVGASGSVVVSYFTRGAASGGDSCQPPNHG